MLWSSVTSCIPIQNCHELTLLSCLMSLVITYGFILLESILSDVNIPITAFSWLVFPRWSFLSYPFTFIVSLIPVSMKLQVWLTFCSYNLSSVFRACPVIFKSTLHVLPLGPSSGLVVGLRHSSFLSLICCFRLALCIFSPSLGPGFHAQLCRLSFLSSPPPHLWVPLVSNTLWLLTLVYSL